MYVMGEVKLMGYCPRCKFESELFAVSSPDYDPANYASTRYELVCRDTRAVPSVSAQSFDTKAVHLTIVPRFVGDIAWADRDPFNPEIVAAADYPTVRDDWRFAARGAGSYYCPTCNHEPLHLLRVAQ